MHLLRRSCRIEGRNGAGGASNPADLGQSSRPPLPIRTLLEDEEDSEDYSENISSTLASLTNSSDAAATRKTSYSPRFDPFSCTIDLDSPPRPPRKEPYLGPAVNSATSNLDPPIDTGSKEGFKDTITSSIVKELSKKAYTIPDDSKLSGESNFEQWIQALSIVLRALGISNFLENPNISNTYSDSDQAVLLMLLRDSLSSGPRAAISWIHIPSKAFKLLVRQYSRPIESKKEDVYNEFHALTFSTYKKGLSAFNAKFNGYLAKLTIAKIDIDPSLILNLSIRSHYTNIDSLSNSDNLVYNIPATYKAKQRKSAKACAAAAKKEDLRRSKRITSSNAGRYTTNSGLIADKDDNNAYNRTYMPPTKAEEEKEEDSSGNNNSINGSTSNSTDKGKGSSIYKRSKGALYYKDTLLYK
ncbi:hypothetical protein P8C59_004277 [Phyllachora maydis]|uniref:Uncharacterized protein n=1 Tax=Phyllachora maydis TaxID=1825666 RepID=A0AAD9MDB4_9PEZI|nr:hypothetical protein P8C59_004277 [Phyllachora maydis]